MSDVKKKVEDLLVEIASDEFCCYMLYPRSEEKKEFNRIRDEILDLIESEKRQAVISALGKR